MEVTATMVKELREKTGVGMMKCKQALQETEGDLAGAEKLLRKKGEASAAKKADRATGEGLVDQYIHPGGKIGALVEVNCETDFAALGGDFRELVHDLAMHIAAAAPSFVERSEVPESALSDEREIAAAQARNEGKPDKIVEKIVEGRLNKFLAQICLLEQPFVKDPDQTVEQRITSTVSKIGENVRVRRFARYVLGEDD